MFSTMFGGLHLIRQIPRRAFKKLSTFSKVAFSDKYLLYTNVGISFTLSGVGDVLEQKYEILRGNLKEWDKLRTHKMALSGVTVGIVCHYYYLVLDRKLPGKSLNVLIKKVLVDQLICSPLCISMFLITVAYLEGRTMAQFVKDYKKKGLKLYFADWIVWPPAQFINFYFLPTKYRVLYDSTISLGYDVYTSYVNHEDDDDEEDNNNDEDLKR